MVADADQDSDTDTEPQAALSVRGLRKVYGGTVALADVDVDVRPGEIHGLLGENGAGKSTLVRLLAGVEPSDGGAITVGGHHLPPRFAPDAIAALGVAIIHQNLGLIEDMSVAENVALAVGYAHSGPMISWKQTRQRARQALDTMGVDLDPDLRAGDLPMSMRSVVAIARALLRDVRLLVLDEPTAGVDIENRRSMWELLRETNQGGTTIILTTHYLEEAENLCRHVAIIDGGRIIENDTMGGVIRKLHQETFVLNLREPLATPPLIEGFVLRLADEQTVEVEVSRDQTLNQVFAALSARGVDVVSMRNKVNRLEELFMRLVENRGAEAAGGAA